MFISFKNYSWKLFVTFLILLSIAFIVNLNYTYYKIIYCARQTFVLVFTFEIACDSRFMYSVSIQKDIKQYVHVRQTSLTKDDRFCYVPTGRLTIISRDRCF